MNLSNFDPAELRRRAEKALGSRDLPSKAQLDPIRLLHELQVHQIELEIQNEDLLAANRDLEAVRFKYQSLYEAAPVGYLTVSEIGEVVDCNARALQMLALNPGLVLKKSLRSWFDAESLADFDALVSEARREGTAASSGELLLRRPKHLPMYVRVQARTLQLPNQNETVMLFVMMDVSALKFATDDIASLIQKDAG